MEKIISRFRPAWAAMAFIGASLLANALNYGFSILIAHGLTPQTYGGLWAAFSLIFIIAIPTIILQTHITNEMARCNMSRAWLSNNALKAMALGGAIAALLIALKAPVSQWFSFDERWIYAIGLQIVASYPLSVFRWGLQGTEDFSGLWSSLVLETASKFGIGMTALFAFHADGNVLLWCISASVVIATFHAWHLNRKSRVAEDRRCDSGQRDPVQFIATFAVVCSLIVFGNADVLVVRSIAPALSHDYVALSRLAQVVPLAAGIVINFFLPRYSRLYSEKRDTKTPFFLAFGTILLGSAFAFGIFSAWSGPLMWAMFWSAYARSADWLPWFSLGTGFLALSQLIAFYLVSVRQKWVTAILPVPAITYGVLAHGASEYSVSFFCRTYAISALALFVAALACILAFRFFRSLQVENLKTAKTGYNSPLTD